LAKRILIYTNHFYPEHFKVNEIVDWLSAEGHNIRVVTGIPNYPSGRYYKGYGLSSIFKTSYRENVIVNRLPLIPRGNGNSFMLILNYLSYFISSFLFTIYLLFKKKYDFIFVHHTSPLLIAFHPIIYSLFYKKTKKYLWDLDIWPETLDAMKVIKSKILLFQILKIVKLIYSFYDKILISSNGLKNTIQQRFKNEIIYFPNWAEKDIEQNINNKQIKIHLPENRFIIMYTGNIGEAQNFIPLIDTIKHLKDEPLFWVFIGSGRFKKEFETKLRLNNLSHLYLFHDPVEVAAIPSYAKLANAMFLSLKKHDVFSKTIPAKLQSYLALQKPIIGVLQGEAANIIKVSECGIVQENGDYLELAQQIIKLIKLNSEEIKKMGENGRNFYNNSFSQSKRRNQILNLFK
tara:strand:+ start:283 stop:1494 length:1212 start_codon:yes stop_codon:yes gene_type:complete